MKYLRRCYRETVVIGLGFETEGWRNLLCDEKEIARYLDSMSALYQEARENIKGILLE